MRFPVLKLLILLSLSSPFGGRGVAQSVDGTYKTVTATGIVNAYLIPSALKSPDAYDPKEKWLVEIPIENTGAVTINRNGLGVKSLKNPDGSELGAGALKAGARYHITYNGTYYQMVGAGSLPTLQATSALVTSAGSVAGWTSGSTANRLLRTDGTTVSFGQAVLTTDVSGILSVANGGSGTSTAFTLGSVLFAGASGTYSQDNTKFFWDDTNNRLGIGTDNPSEPVTIVTTQTGNGRGVYIINTQTNVTHGHTGLYVEQVGTNGTGGQTTYAISGANTRGGSGLNIGVYGGASGGTTNYAGYFSGDIVVTTLTGLLQGNGSSPITAITNSSTVGQTLRVTGASTYAWGALDLSDTDGVTGILPIANGGTGQNSSASTGVAQLSSGTWSFSTALANGTTATTQSAGDNSTKVATTAYVDGSYWKAGGTTTLTSANTITATGTNNFTMNFATLGANTGMLINSNSTDAASNTQTLFKVTQTGANVTSTQTTYAGYFSNTKTGTSNVNYGLYSTASLGTTNYAAGFKGTVIWDASGGAITHLLGPTDQNFSILAPNTTAGGAGRSITLRAGDGDSGGSVAAGSITLTGGTWATGSPRTGGVVTVAGGIGGVGGAVSVTGGTSTSTGGTVTISGGNPGGGVTVTSNAAGALNLLTGASGIITIAASSGTFGTSAVNITTGQSNNAGSTTGAINLTTGLPTSANSGGASGAINIATGTPATGSGSGAASGNINLTIPASADKVTGTGTNAGTMLFTLGAGGLVLGQNGPFTGGNGSSFTITGGAGGAATSNVSGNATGGVGSSLSLTSGNGGNAVAVGTATGGNSGSITLSTGTAGTGASANGTVGSIILATGGTTRLTFSGTGLATFADAVDLVFNTTTGSKIGTATTQKIAFYNSTPIVQPGNTVNIDDLLVNIGLRASGGTAGWTTSLLPRTGTATAGTSPIKLTSSGTGITGLLATAEKGSMEFSDYGLWFSPAASTRHKVLHGLSGGSAPSTNTIGVIVDYYGNSATRVMTAPVGWFDVVDDTGAVRKVPYY